MQFYLSFSVLLATNDEARAASAGVAHWQRGEFAAANDSPPLARMVAALPLLPLGVRSEAWEPGKGGSENGPGDRERELGYAGRFYRDNHPRTVLINLARAGGFLWWALGAWVILRWAVDLHGRPAACLGVASWSCLPGVLGYEQFATPELPGVVAAAAATYAFLPCLSRPGRGAAIIAGASLGLAQLAEFTSLALLAAWPLLALVRRLGNSRPTIPPVGVRTRSIHLLLAAASSLYVINVGYGFSHTGAALGEFHFASRTFGGDREVPAGRVGGPPVGNRSRGTWLGRAIVPLPADYLKGLDRRLHARETSTRPDEVEGWPTEVGRRSPTSVLYELPAGFWALLAGAVILRIARRRNAGTAPGEELGPVVIAATLLVLSMPVIGPLASAAAVLVAAPFLIVISCGIARLWRCPDKRVAWLAIGLSIASVGDCLRASIDRFLTPNRTTALRQQLARAGRAAGVPIPGPRTSTGSGAEERGLIYRRFVDSRGIEASYAIFVPRDYHGDRPYPLILFLNGWGDRGSTPDNLMYTNFGLPFAIKYHPIDFLVLCPQGRSGFWEAGSDDTLRAMEMLDAVRKEYRVDPKRISLTGLSSGGTGVWNLAAAYPDRWSAIVPVAGSCDVDQAGRVRHIPCWCFHNRFDGVFPSSETRRMIGALKAAGSEPRYTEYVDTNHVIERAYVMPELFEWLARQRLP